MVLALAQRPQTQSLNKTIEPLTPNVKEVNEFDVIEFVASCPGCKTLETLLFHDGRLMPTRKFHQRDKEVFHDFGTTQPCRLYQAY